jgi:Signal recognition particle GTPase
MLLFSQLFTQIFIYGAKISCTRENSFQVLGTFDSVASTVKTTLTEALVQILSPRRRVDILRDAMEAKKQARPYVMAFCGVNGVGKSTNLAKVNYKNKTVQ